MSFEKQLIIKKQRVSAVLSLGQDHVFHELSCQFLNFQYQQEHLDVVEGIDVPIQGSEHFGFNSQMLKPNKYMVKILHSHFFRSESYLDSQIKSTVREPLIKYFF